jgi:tRNA-binding EMAP/Myf-like protein
VLGHPRLRLADVAGLRHNVEVGLGVERHPDADKLAVATIDVGGGETLRAVSGAPNLQAGLRVPVALPGARFAGGQLVEAVEIRGVASQVVVLSEREIGISDDHSGVMALGDDAEPGAALATILATADEILEILAPEAELDDRLTRPRRGTRGGSGSSPGGRGLSSQRARRRAADHLLGPRGPRGELQRRHPLAEVGDQTLQPVDSVLGLLHVSLHSC